MAMNKSMNNQVTVYTTEYYTGKPRIQIRVCIISDAVLCETSQKQDAYCMVLLKEVQETSTTER